MCVSAATFGLERSIGGLQGQGYCEERLSLLNVEVVEIFLC